MAFNQGIGLNPTRGRETGGILGSGKVIFVAVKPSDSSNFVFEIGRELSTEIGALVCWDSGSVMDLTAWTSTAGHDLTNAILTQHKVLSVGFKAVEDVRRLTLTFSWTDQEEFAP